MIRYLKLFIISGVFFFIAITGVSLFIPSKVRISRAINLRPGSDSVMHFIGDLAQWKIWYPRLDKEVLMPQKQAGERVVLAKANHILLEIINTNDTLVQARLTGDKKPVLASWELIRDTNSDSVILQNYMDFNIGWYPWDKLSSMVLDRAYGPVMEQGLQNLKKAME